MTDQILEVIKTLAEKRPVFHSEADFVLALGLEIGKLPNSNLRLEYPMEVNYKYPNGEKKQPAYLDMIVKTENEIIGIELKYKTKKAIIELENEIFFLKEHGARDVGRYFFRQDIYRLEQLVRNKKITSGLAIFLTNENKYVSETINKDSLDGEYRLGSQEIPAIANWNTSINYFEKHYNKHEGMWVSKKTGKPSWIYGNEFSKNLDLIKAYKYTWQLYSIVDSERFEYLTIKV